MLVELVSAFLERLLEPSVLAEADLRAGAPRPGLLERILEQWQLADVVLVGPAGSHVEADVADEARGQIGMHPGAEDLGRTLDRGPQLRFAHRPETNLGILDGGAERVVVLDVGVEVPSGRSGRECRVRWPRRRGRDPRTAVHPRYGAGLPRS